MHFDQKITEVLQEIRVCTDEARESAVALEKVIERIADAPEDLFESGFQLACEMQAASSNIIERLGRIQGMYDGLRYGGGSGE